MSNDSDRLRVAVIGLGSIGGVVAGFLQSAERHALVACTRQPVQALVVEHAGGATPVRLHNLTDPDQASPVDWVLLCTKVHDTPKTASWLQRLCSAGTRVAVLQNGVDHLERVLPLVGEAAVVPVLVYFNGERLSAGAVRYRKTTPDDLVVPVGQHSAEFGAVFAGSPLRVAATDDFTTFAWRKFLLNIAANPITALTLQRQAVLRRPDVRELCMALLDEAVVIGRAVGARLDDDDTRRAYDTLLTFPRDAGTSMYFDRLAARPLEVEAMTGALARIGARLGIATPLNATLLPLLRAISDAAASHSSE